MTIQKRLMDDITFNWLVVRVSARIDCECLTNGKKEERIGASRCLVMEGFSGEKKNPHCD